VDEVGDDGGVGVEVAVGEVVTHAAARSAPRGAVESVIRRLSFWVVSQQPAWGQTPPTYRGCSATGASEKRDGTLDSTRNGGDVLFVDKL
jgi:hypothetical protein